MKRALADARTAGEADQVGEVFHEMGYQLEAKAWLQPDVSITHAGQREAKYFQGAPAIAIEIVSAANSAEHLAAKTDLYFEFGAREVWIVYPKSAKIELRVANSSRTLRGDEPVTTPLLPGLSVPVSALLAV